MDETGKVLLTCLKAYHLGTTIDQPPALSGAQWHNLFSLCQAHKLTAIVYHQIYNVESFSTADPEHAALWRQTALLQTSGQTQRSHRFLQLLSQLNDSGIPYVVLKGILCRQLYAQPDLRPSGDEDLLIHPQDLERFTQVFLKNGLHRSDDAQGDSTVHFGDPFSGLHIELHTQLFPESWPPAKMLDAYFQEALDRSEQVYVDGVAVRSLSPTEHLLFLIAHALKHFITGGFGIRTLCDIASYAKAWENRIDRDALYRQLSIIQGTRFFQQIMLIAHDHLGFQDLDKWTLAAPADYNMLLDDILDAGIYGQTSLNRRHSGAVTLEATKTGHVRFSMNVFPPASKLSSRYPWLREKPWLLPAAWIHRISCYGLEVLSRDAKDSSPAQSVSLSKQRIEMMVKYGIISKDSKVFNEK